MTQDLQFARLPKRVQSIIEKMRWHNQKLCKHLHHKDGGDTEVRFFFEPSGKHCGPKSADAATRSGFLEPMNDGLLGPESSQTWRVITQ